MSEGPRYSSSAPSAPVMRQEHQFSRTTAPHEMATMHYPEGPRSGPSGRTAPTQGTAPRSGERQQSGERSKDRDHRGE
jgi:hypothetical protein